VCGDDYHLNLYLNAVHEADRLIGQLIDEPSPARPADDTLIVVTGDHGEAFGAPHRVYGARRATVSGMHERPVRAVESAMFGGGAAGRSKTIGGLIDFVARRCSTPSRRADAVILARPQPARSAAPPRTYFYAVNNDYLLGVRQDDWKYIFNATKGRDELFDLVHDAHEQQNVAGRAPDVCRELRQRVSAWINTAQQPRTR